MGRDIEYEGVGARKSAITFAEFTAIGDRNKLNSGFGRVERTVERLLHVIVQSGLNFMSAIYSVSPDAVKVTIWGRLGYSTWKVLRAARLVAIERQLPLHFDLNACHGGDMGGLGALMIAQYQVGEVFIDGCDRKFSTWFGNIGVCSRCASRRSCSAWRNNTAGGTGLAI